MSSAFSAPSSLWSRWNNSNAIFSSCRIKKGNMYSTETVMQVYTAQRIVQHKIRLIRYLQLRTCQCLQRLTKQTRLQHRYYNADSYSSEYKSFNREHISFLVKLLRTSNMCCGWKKFNYIIMILNFTSKTWT